MLNRADSSHRRIIWRRKSQVEVKGYNKLLKYNTLMVSLEIYKISLWPHKSHSRRSPMFVSLVSINRRLAVKAHADLWHPVNEVWMIILNPSGNQDTMSVTYVVTPHTKQRRLEP